jgi:EAL domain-containing protein (putative c-di-GMP-specific phosphodiesterase class I)
VLQQVATDIATLAADLGDSRVYVNLSLHQVGDPAFGDEVRLLCERFPEIVKRLGFEITESAAMRDAGQTVRTLTRIREFGMPIALDDFGTGCSSLAQLKRLPIDAIKIDRGFVAGIPSDTHDTKLIETQFAIAQQFGYETVAEGVERAEQLSWLRDHGCRLAQGFLIAHPMPLDEYRRWLADAAGVRGA